MSRINFRQNKKQTLSQITTLVCIGLLSFSFLIRQTKNYKIHTLAFYNLENLFDTINDLDKNDETTPLLKIKRNRSEVYQKKINNLARVISEIGAEKTKMSPSILGVAEIENKTVLKDLINSKKLKDKNYGVIHYESPDLRGIDVALLYKKKYFIPISHKSYELRIWSEKGIRIYTRDQLLVSGYLEDELIHIIVNHWPSRRGGERKSRYMREKAAFLNKKISDSILKKDPNSKIVLMGDLNDNPVNSSLKKVLQTKKSKKHLLQTDFFNPYEILFEKGYSTLCYRDNIHLFDQIILSGAIISKDQKFSKFSFYQAAIFNPKYLSVQKGKYKGYPFRSFANDHFIGGYSDHYPVYIYLIKKIN